MKRYFLPGRIYIRQMTTKTPPLLIVLANIDGSREKKFGSSAEGTIVLDPDGKIKVLYLSPIFRREIT